MKLFHFIFFEPFLLEIGRIYEFEPTWLGVSQRPLTLILLQKYCDTNGRRIGIQIGGVYTTFCQEDGILLQKYRDRNGRCIAILFKSIRVRGRFDAPEGPSRYALPRYVFRGSEGCHNLKRIALHPLKGPCSTYLISSYSLPLGRCRGTGGCRCYTVALQWTTCIVKRKRNLHKERL